MTQEERGPAPNAIGTNTTDLLAGAPIQLSRADTGCVPLATQVLQSDNGCGSGGHRGRRPTKCQQPCAVRDAKTSAIDEADAIAAKSKRF